MGLKKYFTLNKLRQGLLKGFALKVSEVTLEISQTN